MPDNILKMTLESANKYMQKFNCKTFSIHLPVLEIQQIKQNLKKTRKEQHLGNNIFLVALLKQEKFLAIKYRKMDALPPIRTVAIKEQIDR